MSCHVDGHECCLDICDCLPFPDRRLMQDDKGGDDSGLPDRGPGGGRRRADVSEPRDVSNSNCILTNNPIKVKVVFTIYLILKIFQLYI